MARAVTLPEYEVFAARFAGVDRRAPDNFLWPQERTGVMPLDFVVWLVRGGGRTVLVDTGFGEHSSLRRRRPLDRTPLAAIAPLGVTGADVGDVVLTHLHYDHAGGLDAFPDARLHVQDREVAYATGRHMGHRRLSGHYEVEDVAALVRAVHAGRVVFHDGDAELAPGVSLHLVGGHTAGLQVVRVHTARGWVVLAGDALHYYANRELQNPFPSVLDVGQLLEGHRRIAELAGSPDHIVPGHDPAVRDRYPTLPGDDGIAVLHEVPRQPVEE